MFEEITEPHPGIGVGDRVEKTLSRAGIVREAIIDPGGRPGDEWGRRESDERRYEFFPWERVPILNIEVPFPPYGAIILHQNIQPDALVTIEMVHHKMVLPSQFLTDDGNGGEKCRRSVDRDGNPPGIREGVYPFFEKMIRHLDHANRRYILSFQEMEESFEGLSRNVLELSDMGAPVFKDGPVILH